MLPSGSGIDSGTKFDLGGSLVDCLVFHVSFHHTNEHGSYDGWTEHKVRVKPAFDGVRLTISGPDRNQVKEYLHEVYSECLTRQIEL